MICRHYLFRDPSGRLAPLPRRIFDGADDGTMPIPGFAGRCVELVTVLLVHERDRAPVIASIDFTKVYFDAKGYVDAGMRDRMIRLMLQSCADRMPGGEPRLIWKNQELDAVSPDPALVRLPDRHILADAAGSARFRLAAEFNWNPDPSVLVQVLNRYDYPLADRVTRQLPALATIH